MISIRTKRPPELTHRGIKLDYSVKEVHALMRRMLFEFGFYGIQFTLTVKSRVRANGGGEPHVRLRHVDVTGIDLVVQWSTSNDSRYDCRLSRSGMKANELYDELRKRMTDSVYRPAPEKETPPAIVQVIPTAASRPALPVLETAPEEVLPLPTAPVVVLPEASPEPDLGKILETFESLLADAGKLDLAENELSSVAFKSAECAGRISELEAELSRKRQELEKHGARAETLRRVISDPRLIEARKRFRETKRLMDALPV
ncbi:MAG TPA: hypothetical protein VFT82_00320 [Candidatus Paceibacterota bacterium]|nr:hypothetical protein [Candidatus Paceibacterota bacterium]